MSQKAITIYTPASAEPHITADDDAFIYSSAYNVKSGIIGSLTCVKVNNNTVRLSGGGVMNRGHILRIPDSENLELSVETGTSGYKRYDSVVAEFIKGGGDDADSYKIRIIQGTPSTSTPSAPTLAKSSLLNKGDSNVIELFRLYINGTTLDTIGQIISTLPKIPNITVGTASPSGGSDGDIYLKIVN